MIKQHEKEVVQRLMKQQDNMRLARLDAPYLRPPVETANFASQYNFRYPDAIYDESGQMIKTGKMQVKKMYTPNKLQGDVYFVNSVFAASPWKPDGHETAYEGVHLDNKNSRHKADIRPIKYDTSPRVRTAGGRRSV